MAVLLQLLEQVAKPTADHASRRPAREQAAQSALKASNPRIAMVSGDMPLLLPGALGVLGPRGPFCMPLSTSSKPIVSSCRMPARREHTGAPRRLQGAGAPGPAFE